MFPDSTGGSTSKEPVIIMNSDRRDKTPTREMNALISPRNYRLRMKMLKPRSNKSSSAAKFSRPGTKKLKYLKRKNDAYSPQPPLLSPVDTPLFNTLHGQDRGAITDRNGKKDRDEILSKLAIISPRYSHGSRSAVRNRNKK